MTEADRAKPRLVRSLSFHAEYGCQNTGVCCSSGWEIAIEEPIELALRRRLPSAGRRLRNGPDGFAPMSTPPKGCRSAFRRTDAGVCWFRDPERQDCAIHREFGEESLASACRQFPRVVVLEPSQVSVSLSHYCPTAAALLFRESADFTMVDSPKAFPASWPFEGLDARDAYSPLLRPGVLLGFNGLRRLETEAITLLLEPDFGTGLFRLDAAMTRIREWTPGHGAVPDFVTAIFRECRQNPAASFVPGDPRPTLRHSVPAGVMAPDLPEFACLRSGISAEVDLALRRYLAARLLAAWVLFQANDLVATARYLRLCVDTVHMFAEARDPGEAERDRWVEAIRSADLWLLHLSDPELLAQNLG